MDACVSLNTCRSWQVTFESSSLSSRISDLLSKPFYQLLHLSCIFKLV